MSLTSANSVYADVKSVSTQACNGAYIFSVTVKSVETGCKQYTDWWEILSDDGDLLYRRILVHSHPTTQPFTRSGGLVLLDKNAIVYVRAHMNKVGYVGRAMRGSIKTGFHEVTKLPTFSEDIEKQSPLPKGCLF